MEKLVSLVWDGHHTTLLSVFEKLLVNSHFVDCTIAAEGQKMKAHKEVLSAFSPFLELLFREETENNPTVIISGISFRDLRSLVDFMYQGKVDVTEERIEDLIDAAEFLQIKGLGGGHKENDSGEINITKVLPKRSSFGIPHKRTRKCERGEAASVDSKKSQVNNLNYSVEIRPENSVVVTCEDRQSSLIQNLMSNSDVQNVAIVSNMPLIPVHSTLSEIEMGSSHLQGEYVATKDPDSVGDDNINGPMRESGRRMSVCGSSGEYAVENAYECSGEESILGLSSDISVPCEKNVYEDLPIDCFPPNVLNSHSCSTDLIGSSVKNQLSNNNVNLSSESVGPVVSAVDTQDPLFHSEFHMEEAASRCILESTYSPEELPAAFLKIQRIRRNDPVVGLMPELPAEVNPHHFSTHPSHTTTVCDRDLSGPIGRDSSNWSSLTNMEHHCRICGKSIRKEVFNVHMRMHALFQNDKCNNALVTSIKLNKQHIQIRRKLYKCTVCEFKSVHSKSLQIHMRIHTGVKPYKCTECKYTSADASNMRRHQLKHSVVKTYKCTECNYTAAKINNLKIHQRIHSGVKPYKCTECKYTCSDASNMKRHKVKHSNVKPYKCAECDFAAALFSQLKRHQGIHSGVKPYKCSECNYASRRRDQLKSHLRTHSKKKP